MHGWGVQFANAKPIKYFWEFTVMNVNRHLLTLQFRLEDGISSIIIGLDIRKYAETCNRQKPRTKIFQLKRKF